MKKLSLVLLAAFSLCLEAQNPVVLNTAGNFAVLGASTVTNTGNTLVNGNVGTFAGTAVTGFPPGVVTGGTIHAGDAVAGQAQGDLTNAYNDAAGRGCGTTLSADIGGAILLPGVYCTAAASGPASAVGITGILTLNGNGNPNAVFIFQIGSTLNTAAENSMIRLIGGAQASNVFWQVGSSATLGTHTSMSGNIMAQASVTLTTGAVLNGRALARTGAVTLDTNSVSLPVPSGGSPTVTCSFPRGTVGQAYSSSLVGSGGTPPYAFSIFGSLPTGLTLNALTGAITGTPTTGGAFSDTSRVVDSLGNAGTSSCGITIAPATTGGLAVTCAANSGQAGQPYVSSLAAVGGTPPYTFSISAGSLPPGLTLDPATGTISGTPSAGSYSYTARVQDSTSASATSSCGPLVVASAAPQPTPGPSTLVLLAIALACIAVYGWRVRLLRSH